MPARNESFFNEECFKKTVTSHWKGLLAFCQHHTDNKEIAREIVQEIFCSLWDRRSNLQINVDLSSYLYSAARNRIARYFRDKYRQEQYQAAIATLFPTRENTTENTVLFHELQQAVAVLVERLPQRCRQVYQLSREDGLSIGAIAVELDISEKTVEAHLTKALKFLRLNLSAKNNLNSDILY